ncbi:HAMP domain-containing histidine kinase [bacterium]|nr:HAMP domain-containing histidine kinase [bacterium]
MAVLKKHNNLKDLIYLQENKTLQKQTIVGIVRTMLEPVLDTPAAGVVLYRLNDRKGLESLLKRLEFANVNVYDFSKGSEYLKQEMWENTEFVYVLTERFGASFIWDYDLVDPNGDRAGYYILYNSRDLCVSFDCIKENSTKSLQYYQDTYKPDRRDNVLMNLSLRKVVDMLNDINQDVMISSIEQDDLIKSDESARQLDFISKKSSYVSHELKNQLSIIDLYTDILIKNTGDNAQLQTIKKSIKMANNCLIDLKSIKPSTLKECELNELVSEACELASVYTQTKEKELEIKVENELLVTIQADYDKFVGVLINLIKNAAEAIEEKGEIRVKTLINDDGNAAVIVENTGKPISIDRREQIFNEGFSTKEKGSGLGLFISKKTIEEQKGHLRLLKSDMDSTQFEVSVPMSL